MTETVVGTLAGRLETAGVERARKKPTTSLTAFDYLLQGRTLVYRYNREDNAKARELLESRGKPPERVGGEDMVGPEGAAALMEVSTLEQLVQLQDAVWGIALGKVPDDVPPSRWPAKAAGQLRAVEMLLDRMMGKPIQRQQVAAVHRIVVERG